MIMSEENNNSDPFDFDFDALNSESSPTSAPSSSFDLDAPFGDDMATSGSEGGVSADNPYLDDSSTADSVAESPAAEAAESADAGQAGKKKGFLGGLFGGKKGKAPKEKQAKEKKIDLGKGKKDKDKDKKEKVVKEKKPAGESAPRDMGTILCIVFSVFLLASLLIFNIATFTTSGKSLMQTLCFLGAFNLVGLAAAAVPILFYKFPKERTLPNVMLGIAAVAILTSLQMAVIEFYRYSFIMIP